MKTKEFTYRVIGAEFLKLEEVEKFYIDGRIDRPTCDLLGVDVTDRFLIFYASKPIYITDYDLFVPEGHYMFTPKPSIHSPPYTQETL